jgi:polyhydroxyalkanoate synthase
VLAGSGHIAGVVNPPAAQKYQYWTNDGKAETLSEFVAGAKETKGSWWPDWIGWLDDLDAAKGPGQGRADSRQGQAQAPGGCARKLCADALATAHSVAYFRFLCTAQ